MKAIDVVVLEQRAKDAEDAALWRFLLRTTDEATPECAVMVGLMSEFEPQYDLDAMAAFEAHVRAGYRCWKAGAN